MILPTKNKIHFQFIFAVLLCCVGHNTTAQLVTLSTENEAIELRDNIQFYQSDEDSKPYITLDRNKLLPYDYHSNTLVPNKNTYGYFELESNVLNTSEWVVEFPRIFTEIELTIEYENKNTQEYKSGFFTPLSERSFKPQLKPNLFKVNIPVGAIVNVYFKAKCERHNINPTLDATIVSSKTYHKNLVTNKILQSLFIGFIFMMLVYNLFVFLYNRTEIAYPFYSIYLIGIIIYVSYITGDIYDVAIPLLFSNAPQYINFAKLSVYLIIISYLFFLREFLNLKILLPRWDKILKFLIFTTGPFILLDAYLIVSTNFNNITSDIITLSFSGVFILVLIIFCFFIYKTKDIKGYYIIAGILIMCLSSLITIYARIQSVDYSGIYFQIGLAIEVVIFSMGLAYKRMSLEKEQQVAELELSKNKSIQELNKKESQRLRELDEIKNKFYTNISHEFRTPLTVIMGLNQDLMENNKLDSNSHKKHLTIDRNSNNLLGLINQILNLSKIESGNLKINMVQTDIISILKKISDTFYNSASLQNIEFHFYSEVRSLIMDTDKFKLNQIVSNLISNAIKFSHSHSEIILHISTTDTEVAKFLNIKLTDSGIGIPKQDLEKIFNRYYRVNESGQNAVTGTGVGLSLTKELVELLGGEIQVDSTVNVGSTFTVKLPITNNSEIDEHNDFESIPITQILKEDSNNDELVNLKQNLPIILIVEDNKDIIALLFQLLGKEYNILTAYNGSEGVKKAVEYIPDIIISDVMMPILSGYELTEQLKTDERTSHIPIILLTAKTKYEDKIEGIKHGADAYLTKPFKNEELRIRINNLLELRKKLQKRYAEKVNSKKHKTNDLNDKFLLRVREIVFESIDESTIDLNKMSRELNLSRSQFSRKLKAIIDLTPTEYITQIRLIEAKRLLDETDFNISEIAYKVGYSNPNYFTRIYTKKMGHPPSIERKH